MGLQSLSTEGFAWTAEISIIRKVTEPPVCDKITVYLGEKELGCDLDTKKERGQWFQLEPDSVGKGRVRGKLPDGPVLFPNKTASINKLPQYHTGFSFYKMYLIPKTLHKICLSPCSGELAKV